MKLGSKFIFIMGNMCSNDSVVVDVPAPDEPVTAMIGFRDDIVDSLRIGVKCYTVN